VKFSAVIPAFNESAQIASALKRLRQISRSSPLEIILVDGHSDDETASAARAWADRVIALDVCNRGEQLDAGARAASGDLLLFLSADAQPPGDWQRVLERFWLSVQGERVAATAFRVDYGAGLGARLAGALANARARWLSLAGIDHGLCTTPEIYRAAGGFPPGSRDAEGAFCASLRRAGRIVLLSERVRPAARALRRDGLARWALAQALGTAGATRYT
jgi:glycosyltransferase involved in cell wall biosynthesis